MAAGLQVFNNSGVLQIDSLYSNMAMAQKGTISVTTKDPYGFYTWTGTLTATSRSTPLLALKSSVPVCVKTSRSGSTFTFTVMAFASTTVTYYLFDDASTVPSSNAGFQVWSETGKLIFDGSKPYLRVLDVLSGTADDMGQPTTTVSTGGINRSYPAVGEIAVIQGMLNVTTIINPVTEGGGGFTRDLDYGVSITPSANTARFQRRYWENQYYDFMPSAPFQQYFNWMIVDVTNF